MPHPKTIPNIIINTTYLLIFLSKLSKRLRTSLGALLLSLTLLLQPTTRQALQTLLLSLAVQSRQ